MVICLHSPTRLKHHMLAIADALTHHGLNAEFRDSVDPTNDTWIGVIHRTKAKRFPKKLISYNTESILDFGFTSGYPLPRYMSRASEIWDYSYTNVKILEAAGIKSIYVPMGYSTVYEKVFAEHVKAQPAKDIDVLFYGGRTPRRNEMIRRFREAGMSTYWIGEIGNYDYAETRDNLISRSKIVVSICRSEPRLKQTNDFLRLCHLISNKAFFVAEIHDDPQIENLWKDHAIFVTYDKMVEVCLSFVNDENARREVAESAYVFAVNNFNMKDIIADRIADLRSKYEN